MDIKYYNIVSNISKEWKNKLKDENYNNLPKKINKALHIITQQKGSINKSLYKLQLDVEKVPTIKAEEKWIKEFPQQEMNWSQFYQMSFSCTVDVKLRNFNYKYLMRIIPNNRYLFKCKLVPSVLCDFCSIQEETNFHLFWQCWCIQDLWSNVQEILTSNNIEIQLSYFNISFGINCKNKPKNLVFNFIVLLVKYYIFSSKYKLQIPTINGFLQLLHQTREIEEHIAFSKDKLEVHRKKWQLLQIT